MPAIRVTITLCLLAMMWAAIVAPAAAATLRGIRVTADAVTLEFDSAPAGVSSFTLDSPRRIVVDLADTKLGTGSQEGAGPIAKVRAAQFSADAARLVIDLSTPAITAGGAATPDGHGFALRIAPASDVAFAKAAAGKRIRYTAPQAAAAAPQAQPAVNRPPPAVEVPLPKPEAIRAEPKPEPKLVADRAPGPQRGPVVRANRPLVVLDPGHGGHDTGAISPVTARREKDLVLAIGLEVRNILIANGRVRVAMTRGDDRFLALGERVNVARRQKADLFVSIHADSAPNPEARGATVYTLSEVASDREAARLAANENRSDIINGVDLGKEQSDVSSILIDLAQRESMNVSSSFAALLQRELESFVTFKSEFHRFAGFRVLKAADTPSVLIETGYVTNAADVQFLSSSGGQRAIATGIARAIEAHFARRWRNAGATR